MFVEIGGEVRGGIGFVVVLQALQACVQIQLEPRNDMGLLTKRRLSPDRDPPSSVKVPAQLGGQKIIILEDLKKFKISK